jgi:hypothetical protein
MSWAVRRVLQRVGDGAAEAVDRVRETLAVDE